MHPRVRGAVGPSTVRDLRWQQARLKEGANGERLAGRQRGCWLGKRGHRRRMYHTLGSTRVRGADEARPKSAREGSPPPSRPAQICSNFGFPALLKRLAKVDVLIIDDWGLAPPKDAERRDLLETLEDRYGARSTVITSQFPTTKWHDHLGDPTVADAIGDRVLHGAHRLVLKGPSRRKEESAT